MGKRGGAANSKHKVKKPAQKTKKSGHFKALTKQETRQVIVQTEKKQSSITKPTKPKRTVPDEFRNFDERMAAMRVKKQSARAAPVPANSVVAAPSFVMPAATFQLNTAPPPQPATREVEGFHGFLAAMQAPPTAPPPTASRESRTQKQKTEAPRNVFAVLDDEPDPMSSQSTAPAPVPSFLQPATFTFQTHTSSSSLGATTAGLTSLQRSLLGVTSTPFRQATTEAIDPDL